MVASLVEVLEECLLHISIFISESMILLGFFAGIGVRVVNELGAGNAKRAKFATAVDQVEIPTTLLAFNILLNCIQLVLSGVAVGSSSQGVVAFVNIGSYQHFWVKE
ncbi:protein DETOXIFICATION 27-like isoform X4 [Durio zibethinus]|uniref:Protein DETOXIFICATION 27-like isoform X4 n=1 Tax=Durio zibethinus TaxID=66656 RepID=A0A6P5XSA8_DURZI|nr:protein DETOXIFICATION 27-like isoform X4 [Durio zibethinus]